MKRVKCDRETALLNPSLIQPETRKYKLFWSIAGNWSTCEPFNLLFGSDHTARTTPRPVGSEGRILTGILTEDRLVFGRLSSFWNV
jgi:hypothetical protein